MRQPRVALLQFLLSLVLALALWTFVSFTQNPTQERTFEVPITTTGLSQGLAIIDPQTGIPGNIDETIEVLASGPRLDILQARQDQFRATVNLSGLGEGIHQVEVNVNPPNGLRLVDYQPNVLTVQLEPITTKTFPIRERITGQSSYIALEEDAVQLATDRAIATGPSDLIDRIAQVQVEVDLQGRLTSYTELLPLEPVDQNGEPVPGITLSPNETNVTVNIQPRVNVQPVSIVPQVVGEPAPGYTVEQFDWTPKTVEVIAPIVISSTLQTEPITLTNRTESFTQTARLIKPDDIVTRLPDDTVTVTVQIAPFGVESNVPLFVPTVIVENLPPDVRTETLPPGFTIIVSGTYQQLSQLAGATVQATVDASGLGPGTHTLPATIDLPPGVNIVGDPPTATITLIPNAPSTPTPNAPQQNSLADPGG